MDIFLFNRKLMWVVVPLVFWSLLVLFVALEDENSDKSGLGLKVERRGIRLPGRLLSATEDAEGNLEISLGVRRLQDGYAVGPDGDRMQELPAGLQVSYQKDEPGRMRQRPQISLLSGSNEPLEFLRGNLRVLITEKFVLRMSHQGLQVIPKGPGFDQRRFIQELQQRRKSGPDGPGAERPGGMLEPGQHRAPGDPPGNGGGRMQGPGAGNAEGRRRPEPPPEGGPRKDGKPPAGQAPDPDPDPLR